MLRIFDRNDLYIVGRLSSRVEHIDLLGLCVYFKSFIEKKHYTATEVYRMLAVSIGFC